MTKKQIIAFDCDDVIVATGSLLVEYYNKLHGTNVQAKDFYSKDYKCVWMADSATVAHDLFAYILTDECASLLPMDGASDVLRELAKKYTLYIVTGRPGYTEKATNAWIDKYLPGIFEKVVFTNFFKANNSRGATRTKADVCRELGAEYLVDDHLAHIRNVAKQGVAGLLFGNLSWEQVGELPPKAVKVDDWNGLRKYFNL